jgi:hypothetical protein
LVLQSLQKPQRSIAAARTEDGSYRRVRKSVIQFREPPLIVARKIPVSPENAWVELNAVAVGNDREARVK